MTPQANETENNNYDPDGIELEWWTKETNNVEIN